MANYNSQNIIDALQEVGLKKGDDVFLHTNLGFFGRCEGANSADSLCEIFYESIKEIIGDDGTLIVPTFTYSSCHKEKFDPAITKSEMGMFSDYIWRHESSVRSLDPNFSIVAIGAKADFYTQDPPEKSFGDNCFFERFYLNNGFICNFNFDAGTTYVHYVEHKLKVPYRYDKKFVGEVLVDGKWENRTSYHFVYDKEEDEPVFERLHELCIQSGVAKIAKLGKGVVLGEHAQDLFNLIRNTMEKRPRFLLKEE